MRTTDILVKEIIETDTSVSLSPFIAIANELVTEVCGEAHAETRLTLIETWLTAHFYAIRDNRLASEDLNFMELGLKYQYKLGLNLQVTMYGQQVLIMDTSGGFANLNLSAENGKVAKTIQWLGTEAQSGL